MAHNLFGSSLYKQVAFLFNFYVDFSTLSVSEDSVPSLLFVKDKGLWSRTTEEWRSLLAI